jgi:hypothetical protein
VLCGGRTHHISRLASLLSSALLSSPLLSSPLLSSPLLSSALLSSALLSSALLSSALLSSALFRWSRCLLTCATGMLPSWLLSAGYLDEIARKVRAAAEPIFLTIRNLKAAMEREM